MPLSQTQRRLLAKYKVHCLYSLQHVRNLRSIESYGILSRCRVQSLGLQAVDISDRNVQWGRMFRRIGERSLHEYVPLFFRPLTPMQYVVCVQKGMRDEVALIEVDVSVFALPGVIFTDGNARSHDTRFYEELDDLEKLDWNILDIPNAWSKEYKRKKSAEVLVPDAVPPGYLKRYYVTRQCRFPQGLLLPCVRDEAMFP
jgi:hypothetical protein